MPDILIRQQNETILSLGYILECNCVSRLEAGLVHLLSRSHQRKSTGTSMLNLVLFSFVILILTFHKEAMIFANNFEVELIQFKSFQPSVGTGVGNYCTIGDVFLMDHAAFRQMRKPRICIRWPAHCLNNSFMYAYKSESSKRLT